MTKMTRALRILGVVVALVTAVIASFAGYIYHRDSQYEERMRKLADTIDINASHTTSYCDTKYPIQISVQNKDEEKTLKSLIFHLAVYVPGNSTDLNSSSLSINWDAIIPPKSIATRCYTPPKVQVPNGVDPDKLIYKAWAYPRLTVFYDKGEFIPTAEKQFFDPDDYLRSKGH